MKNKKCQIKKKKIYELKMHQASKQSEYEFIIDKKHYFIPSILVQPFSNVIKKKDQTENVSVFQFENLIDPYQMFNLIVDLFYGRPIEIDEKNAFFLGFIADNIGITALSEATNSYRQIELTIDNIFDILNHLDTFHITDQRIMKYVGQNWPLLSKSENIFQLSFFTLNEIFLQNPEISIEFDLVLKIIDANSPTIYTSQKEDEIETAQLSNEFIQLFRYCDFSKLSSFEIDQMLEYLSFDSINPKILEKLIRILSTENNRQHGEKGQNGEKLMQRVSSSDKSKSASFSAVKSDEDTNPKLPTNQTFKKSVKPSTQNNSSQNKFQYHRTQQQSDSSNESAAQPKFSDQKDQSKSKTQKDQSKSKTQKDQSNNKFRYTYKQPELDSKPKHPDQQSPPNNASSEKSSPALNKASGTKPPIHLNNQFRYSYHQAEPGTNTNTSTNNVSQQEFQSGKLKPAVRDNALTPIADKEESHPSAGVAGSRKGKPPPTLPSSSNFVSVDYELGYELRGVVTVFQDSPTLSGNKWMKEVEVIVAEGTKVDFRYNMFDHTSRTWWSNYDGTCCSLDKAWIIVGFPNYTLRLQYYTLASKEERQFYSQPMSWKIYGSDNSSSFSEEDLIEYVKSAPSMNIPKPMKTFQVAKKAKPYSYFMFVLLKNYSSRKVDQGELTLSGLELFGILTAK